MTKTDAAHIIRAQQGFQEAFLSSPADIVIGGGAAGCFTSETLIRTPDGLIPIYKIKKGQKVLSVNLKTKELEFRKVLKTFVYGGASDLKNICIFKLSNGLKIKCTENHEFYFNGSWIAAGEFARRKMEIYSEYKKEIFNFKQRQDNYFELEKCQNSQNNEACFRWIGVLSDCNKNETQRHFEILDNKNSQNCGNMFYSKQRQKFNTNKSYRQSKNEQLHGKFRMVQFKNELSSFQRKYERIYKHKSAEKNNERIFKRMLNIKRIRYNSNKEKIYSKYLHAKNACRRIQCERINNKRYCKWKELEACSIDINEIKSIEFIISSEFVYDLCVESNHNYCITNKNILVHNSGKTFAELLKPIYHCDNPRFGAVMFRRTYAQIKNTGGLWDQSKNVYPHKGAKSNETEMSWTFPSGATVKFSHLQHEKNIYDHQGAEYPMIIFDEVTHFTEAMFWYLLSRNRSTCGVKPKVLATCNPDPDSFVARLIDWWIDVDTGLPIPERSGKLRYFIRDKGALVWGDTKQEVIEQVPYLFESLPPEIDRRDLVKSLTFIAGSIYGNKELLKINPDYLSNLMAQDEAARAQLLDGNWKIRQDNTSLFNFAAINDVFTNFINDTGGKYITCDAARFGRDLCVIMVWQGWEVVHIEVMKKSDVHDIIDAVEVLREKFQIGKSGVLIDRDGVGAGTVKQGGYRGFSGADTAKKFKGFKEHYKNFKTQCYYYLAEEIVNIGALKININNECCVIDGVRSSKIKLGSKIVGIDELIREDLRAIKRANIDQDGKFQINTKEEQKVILGRSPDFGDTLMMRVAFEFINLNPYI